MPRRVAFLRIFGISNFENVWRPVARPRGAQIEKFVVVGGLPRWEEAFYEKTEKILKKSENLQNLAKNLA